MSEATKDFEQRLKDAKEYYHTNDCSIQEAARQFDLKNHKTLSNRIYDKHASASQSGGCHGGVGNSNAELTDDWIEQMLQYSGAGTT